MNTLPLVRANALSPILRLLNQGNAPTRQLLLQARLPEAALDESEALISLYQGFNFIDLAAHHEGIALLGVLAAQEVEVRDLGILGKVFNQSLTFYDLLQTMAALMPTAYNSGVRFWLTQTDDRIWLNHQYAGPANLANHQVNYYGCLAVLRVLQLIAGPAVQPTDLHFQAAKRPGLEQIELLGTARFHQPYNAIGFSISLLHLPIQSQGNGHRSNSQDLYENLQSSAPAIDFVESLRQFIRQQVQSGQAPIEMAAEAARNVSMILRHFVREISVDPPE